MGNCSIDIVQTAHHLIMMIIFMFDTALMAKSTALTHLTEAMLAVADTVLLALSLQSSLLSSLISLSDLLIHSLLPLVRWLAPASLQGCFTCTT